ncbi:serine/threonine protein kinase [Gemmata sp. JC673]|uniref:Serine/threonine protein kinase n=1 Tax=Gemmata algarum TaxID=2975278 RepID=A0ABU5F1E6_9BACT|nr:serine/threonine-protein kinase [Gemmata algarum]MDY3561324.1 serine/threonine protein kinase [Gemmata algarum]
MYEGPTTPAPPFFFAPQSASAVRPLPAPPPGFDLLRRLGEGGMGDVYLARECPSGREVALKFLKRPEHYVAHQRFVTELQVLVELAHPNIVPVYASDFMRSTPFFTMEHATGGSLSDVFGAGEGGPNPLTLKDATHIIRVVAGAIAAAHAKGIIHRDLKPGNVLLFGGPREWDKLKVADFGLARRLSAAGDENLTVPTDTIGTPGYAPPEQVSRANGDIDFRADVYGLGATLYHLLTGRAPFTGPTQASVIEQVLADPPERVRKRRPEVPLRLEAIVLKCLAKDPADRYESVTSFLADLDRYEAGLRPNAPLMTRRRRARYWANDRRHALAGAAALMFLTSIGSVGAMRGVGLGSADAGVIRPPLVPVPKVADLPATPSAVTFCAELTAEDVTRALRNGQRVELLGRSGPRTPIGWGLNPCPATLPEGGGNGLVLKGREGCALQLLADPGVDSYRIRAVLRQDRRTPPVGPAGSGITHVPRVGIVLGYRRIKANDCTVNAFVTATICESGRNGQEAGELALTDCGVIEYPLERPSWCRYPNGRLPLTANETTPSPRTLEVDVTPQKLVFRHGGQELVRPTVIPRGWVAIEDALNANPQLGGQVTLGAWSPRRPVGIWVQESWATVLSFSIEPLPK